MKTISPTTKLGDLNIDSLDMVEIVMELEEEFDISIPDNAVELVNTVGDLIRLIQQQGGR